MDLRSTLVSSNYASRAINGQFDVVVTKIPKPRLNTSFGSKVFDMAETAARMITMIESGGPAETRKLVFNKFTLRVPTHDVADVESFVSRLNSERIVFFKGCL